MENYNSTRRLVIEREKDPFKTFIGGLIFGSLIGAIITFCIMANWVVNNFS
jgi:hypothetical protein